MELTLITLGGFVTMDILEQTNAVTQVTGDSEVLTPVQRMTVSIQDIQTQVEMLTRVFTPYEGLDFSGSMTREDSVIINQHMIAIQQSLGIAMPAHKAIRRLIFSLKPGESSNS